MEWWQVMLGANAGNLAGGTAAERAARAARFSKYRREMRASRAESQGDRDRDQDEQIAGLRTELDQVQIALGVLSQLLVDKGVLPREELTELIELTVAERAGAAKRPPAANE